MDRQRQPVTAKDVQQGRRSRSRKWRRPKNLAKEPSTQKLAVIPTVEPPIPELEITESSITESSTQDLAVMPTVEPTIPELEVTEPSTPRISTRTKLPASHVSVRKRKKSSQKMAL